MTVNHTSRQILERGLTLSRRLLELMKDGDWEEAAKLEAERLRAIQKGLAAEPAEDLPEKIAILREIDVLNREMESIGVQGKSKLSSQLRQLKQGRKAGRAYRQGHNS